MVSAVSRPRSAFISATVTAAPSAANRSQIARPIPLPPPVTMATLPESFIFHSPALISLGHEPICVREKRDRDQQKAKTSKHCAQRLRASRLPLPTHPTNEVAREH